jgi:predicted O-methyltransferase YrrM
MIKTLIKKITPKPLLNLARYQIEQRSLGKIPSAPASFDHLRRVDRSDLNQLFHSDLVEAEWNEVQDELKQLGLWNPQGGTGAPDLRALYYLIRHFGCSSVLEVGTHIGCSTATTGIALGKQNGPERPTLVTVDIADVNDETHGPWREIGLTNSPGRVIENLHLDFEVKFVQSGSVDYLRNTDQQFDFIFLDGDHTAGTVYREIALASRALRPEGLIALHDYSPRLMFQHYYDGWTIPGPYLAARRISREHETVDLIELGRLPWMTGKGTSLLAILARS